MDKLVLRGLTHPGVFELGPGFNTVGRNPTNDFRVPDSTVSSFHCEIIVTESGEVVVRDLNSTNGTFIDDRQIQEAPIRPHQVLRLGSAEVRLEMQSAEEPAHVAIPELIAEQPPASATLPDGSLSCLNHPETRATLRCAKCGDLLCDECVHVLRLTGGKTRVFCPSCSGHCEPLPGAPPPSASAKSKKSSLLARLSQTIRIRLK